MANKHEYKLSPLRRLTKAGLAHPPVFVDGSLQYETLMGSVAYGVSSDSSDNDVYGFAIPPKDYVFPHTMGHIVGFSRNVPTFEVYQEHHINEPDRQKSWDFQIYSIIKYFRLAADNNPNIIDSMFTAVNMRLTVSPVANLLLDNRRTFLHKGAWHRFKGYAYAQMAKMKVKEPDPNSKRYESVKKHGYDVKFAYHVVRLLNEVEMIMTEGDLDLMRNNDQLKAIRNGDWKLQDVEDYFIRKEKDLETLYTNCKLPYSAPEEKLTQLLTDCLEMYYGSLGNALIKPDRYEKVVNEIKNLLTKV